MKNFNRFKKVLVFPSCQLLPCPVFNYIKSSGVGSISSECVHDFKVRFLVDMPGLEPEL
ncbi:MAG TPA: hypothetical protein PKD51_11465 [Saprospiraceae bacterium]|nr:hypothetical protein [Saprospiraceae bacterium]HMU05891.1 hypothetical protein [Saprospiraceae bacterium]